VIEKSGSEEKPKVRRTTIRLSGSRRRFFDQLYKKMPPHNLAPTIRLAGKAADGQGAVQRKRMKFA
jgi:hypothetical protein